jgi:predicted molibdopterin-dependent oxidoreductase YjgC
MNMGSKPVIVVDGQEFTYTPGETILDVANRNQINIPTLCYLKGASPTGACRICVVELEGARNLVASCATPATANVVVRTESPRVIEARRLNLELLLSSGHHNCLAQSAEVDSWTEFQLKAMASPEHADLCPVYGECRLQDLAIRYQVTNSRFPHSTVDYPIENVNPFIVRDFSRCILCGRCVQACNDIQVNNAISFGYRGTASKIVAKSDLALKDSDCVFCGECVQACPVGALIPKGDGQRPGPLAETNAIRTTCSYCGVGCQIYLHVKDEKIVRVTGVEGVGPNFGSLCVKGRFGYHFIHDSSRLKMPLIRENGDFREASWDEALNLVAKKLHQIKAESGPDSMLVLSSARITNEENYLAQKFTRAVLGTNNVDHCARL